MPMFTLEVADDQSVSRTEPTQYGDLAAAAKAAVHGGVEILAAEARRSMRSGAASLAVLDEHQAAVWAGRVEMVIEGLAP